MYSLTRSPRTLLLSLLSFLWITPAVASTISMPYAFSNGTPADADEVNANFDTLVLESNAQDSRIAAIELLGGDISEVTAGYGLSGGGASGAVSLAVDPSVIQQRVGQGCPVAEAIRAVNEDGTVVCEPFGSGDITGVIAGVGLSGGGSSGVVTLDVSGIGSSEILDGSITDDDVGQLEHGLLGGLGDDDHPQYLLKTGGSMNGDLVMNGNDITAVDSLEATTGEFFGNLFALDRLYVDNTTNYLSHPTGDFGSVQINGGGKNAYEGFSIDGNYAMMTDGANLFGLYDDAVNNWITVSWRNVYYEIRNGQASAAVHIDNVGNVGIATPAPAHKLDVNGTGRFTDDLYAEGRLYVDNAENYLSYPTGDYGSVQINGDGKGTWAGYSIDGEYVTMSKGGQFGHYDDVTNTWITRYDRGIEYSIYAPGTNKPALSVTAAGTMTIRDPLDQYYGSLRHSGVGGNFHLDTDHGSIYLSWFSGGGVYVGDGGAGYGPVLASSYNVASDRRLKTDIVPLEDSLRRVRSLDAYSFRMKSTPDGPRKLGLMAQEVEAVYPEAVSYDDEGFRLVDYSSLIAPVVAAVSELADGNDALRGQIAALEAAQDAVLGRIATLEGTRQSAQR